MPKKNVTTHDFIQKARDKHGDKYDYSKVDYINSSTKIIITCKKHGEFLQTPSKHLSKQGCSKCSGSYRYTNEEYIEKVNTKHHNRYGYSLTKFKRLKDKIKIICIDHGVFEQIAGNHLNGAGCPICANLLISNSKKKTAKQFIEEANKKHDNKYDYSLVEYVGCYNKVKIICKEHGEFEQAPCYHLQGQGCSKCSGKYNYTNDEYIEEVKKKHGNKYDYSFTEYIRTEGKIKIICKKHGLFEQRAGSHLKGQGCSKCAGCYNYTTEEYIEKVNQVHKNKYDYSLTEYKKKDNRIKIICKEHGVFEQVAGCHLQGQGCSKCAGCHSYTTEEYIEKANQVHKNKYDYSLTIYNRTEHKIKILCKEHGVFEQTAHSHLSGIGCPKCKSKTSKPAQQWIDYLSITKPDIQHFYSENGEFSIPDSKYKADGYDEETNTIYEFHGDFWHGNPKLFNQDEVNKITKTTFGELFEKTISKEEFCKSKGYKYIALWENDWKKGVNALRKIQKKFKKLYIHSSI